MQKGLQRVVLPCPFPGSCIRVVEQRIEGSESPTLFHFANRNGDCPTGESFNEAKIAPFRDEFFFQRGMTSTILQRC